MLLLLLRAGAGERAVPIAFTIFTMDTHVYADSHARSDRSADGYALADSYGNANGHAYRIPGANAISDDAALGLDLIAIPINDLVQGLPV